MKEIKCSPDQISMYENIMEFCKYTYLAERLACKDDLINYEIENEYFKKQFEKMIKNAISAAIFLHNNVSELVIKMSEREKKDESSTI